jgi:RNA polymerase sigma-70 factor (ECF subfamily)
MGRQPATSGKVTSLLLEMSGGNRAVADELVPYVYRELKRIAAAQLRRERPGHTLQITALVHEAYLKLVDQRQVTWRNRAHFLGVAAQVMRRILLDYARARAREKRGGDVLKTSVNDLVDFGSDRTFELIQIDQALEQLAAHDERQAKVVEMRFFGGLSVQETAEVLEVSEPTVIREWAMARAWLRRAISNGAAL